MKKLQKCYKNKAKVSSRTFGTFTQTMCRITNSAILTNVIDELAHLLQVY